MMKHEKAILVGLGYLNGFIVAFIAFALPSYFSVPEVASQNSTETYIQQPSTTKQLTASGRTVLEDSKATRVYFDDFALVAEVQGEKRAISAQLYGGAVPGPGLHVDIPVVAASPDGKYVYYCEQQLSTTDVCHEYLYVVDEHVIKPLTFAGKSLTSDDEDMNFVWSGSRISSNKYLSVSPETPWILTTRE